LSQPLFLNLFQVTKLNNFLLFYTLLPLTIQFIFSLIGLRVLPIFYFFCIAFNIFTISYQGSKILGLESIPLWLALVISLLTAILAALVVHFILKPRLSSWIHRGVLINNVVKILVKLEAN